MDTDPSGLRIRPPTTKTTVGNGEDYPESITVVMNLLNEPERTLYNAWFLYLDWWVITAETVSDIDDALERESIDFVITDQIPSLDAIRLQDKNRLIPVVFIGDNDPSLLSLAKACGATYLVPRPIDIRNPLGNMVR